MLILIEKNEAFSFIGLINFLGFITYNVEDYDKSAFFFN